MGKTRKVQITALVATTAVLVAAVAFLFYQIIDWRASLEVSKNIIEIEEPTQPVPSVETITISFVGDCLLSSSKGKSGQGTFNWYAKNYPETYFFEKVVHIFNKDDLTVGNCETVFTDRNLPENVTTKDGHFWFKGPVSNARIFTAGGFDFVSLANNHTLDYDEEGHLDTQKALSEAGVLYGIKDKVEYKEIKGIKIAFLCVAMYDAIEAEEVFEKLNEIKDIDCDLKILYIHCGAERLSAPEKWKVEACRKFVDAGADLIVGSHPHVLQPMEIYKDKAIVYSLGNFCFGGNTAPARDTIIYQAKYKVIDGEIAEREDIIIPCKVYNGSRNEWQPSIVEDEKEKQRIINFMQTKIADF